MLRAMETFGGVLIMALLAGGLTEATLAFGGHSKLANDALLRPVMANPSPKPTSAAPTATPTPTPTATPAPATPTPTAAVPTATTNSFVHMRTGNSTATPIITDLNAGTVVQILPVSDAQWQQVRYNGQVGYLFKAYLTY